MINSHWGLSSEVDRLEAVLVHTPGQELNEVHPWNMEEMLFDGIIYLDKAIKEHEGFVKRLKEAGARCYQVRDLLSDVLDRADVEERREVLEEILGHEEARRLEKKGIRLEDIGPDDLIVGKKDVEDKPIEEIIRDVRERGRALFLLRPLPNLYFTRDPAVMSPLGVIICRMRKEARRREARIMKAIFEHHELFQGLNTFEISGGSEEGFLEGGDFFVLDEETILIGTGERSDEEGFRQVREKIISGGDVKKVIRVSFPKKRTMMHLDTTFTMIDRNKFLVFPFLHGYPEPGPRLFIKILDHIEREAEVEEGGPTACNIKLNIYSWKIALYEYIEHVRNKKTIAVFDVEKGAVVRYPTLLEALKELGFIEDVEDDVVYVAGAPEVREDHIALAYHALREQWDDAANVLAIRPGEVISYDRNELTIRALKDFSIRVLEIEGDELIRGRGGPRCMSMPLRRRR